MGPGTAKVRQLPAWAGHPALRLAAGSVVVYILARGLPIAALPDNTDGLFFEDAAPVCFAICGLVAWWRRPRDLTGPLMLSWVVLWGAELSEIKSDVPALFTFGSILDPAVVYGVVVAYLVLGFPEGRIRGAGARLVLYVLVLIWLIEAAAILVYVPCTGPFCSPRLNLFLIHPDGDLLAKKSYLDARLYIAAALVFVAILCVRLLRATPVARRVVGPLYVSAAVAALYSAVLWIVAESQANPTIIAGVFVWSDSFGRVLGDVGALATAFVPVGFLYGLQRARGRRAQVAVLVRELGSMPSPAGLRAALAKALGDPSLQLGLASGGGYARPDLEPLVMPDPDDPHRTVTPLAGPGGPVAALVHDRALLLDDRELLEAVSVAAGLAVDNERLQEDLQRRFDELRESRTRIVAAGDEARRRIERNLHDGAQQRLVSLLVALRLAELQAQETGDPELQATIADMAEQLNSAIDELRELARGLHPAVLTEGGLAAAVKALAARAAVAVEIVHLPERRLDPTSEAAAYYVVAEALTNASRHGAAERVVVDIAHADDTLHVGVRDDGRGGATLGRGTGLRGLSDRVEAAGGVLEVDSPPGKGTVVRARIPSIAMMRPIAPPRSRPMA